MPRFLFILLLAAFSVACMQKPGGNVVQEVLSLNENSKPQASKDTILNARGKVIEDRFNPPRGYKRITCDKNSFAAYLRQLPLKPHDSFVEYYDGGLKYDNDEVYIAVIDLPIGKRDLHQCADAIMRLRAEYFWKKEEYDKIHFNFTNGFRVDYIKWMDGNRIVVKGNKTYWTKSTQPSNTYQNFWKYMEIVFSYAGTLSLSRELVPVKAEDMQIGDVFIFGGAPGHAVIIVDMAEHINTGEKLFMLAQSYMPAQETQILMNPNNSDLSPWYRIEPGYGLQTPEWSFAYDQLMRFPEE